MEVLEGCTVLSYGRQSEEAVHIEETKVASREVDENCILLGCYAASTGNLFLFGFLTLENGTDRWCRNVGRESPLLAA